MSRVLNAQEPVALTSSDGSVVRRLLVAATWSQTQIDSDMSALLLRQSGNGFQVPSADYFLHRSRTVAPDGVAFLGFQKPGEEAASDRAQVLIDLEALPSDITRVMIAMSPLQRNGLVSEQGTLRTRVADVDSGETMYVYSHQGPPLAASCVSLWMLDRGASHWMGRVIAEPYPGGPPALVRNFGVLPSGR